MRLLGCSGWLPAVYLPTVTNAKFDFIIHLNIFKLINSMHQKNVYD